MVFCGQCWQTVHAGVPVTSGSALVSAKGAGICRVRLPSQLFMKYMWMIRSLKERAKLPAILGTSTFQADLATKARLAKEFQPLLHTTRLCEPSHR